MRKNFTPLLLIPIFIFACSKHQSQPVTPPTPVDSTASGVYLDPGTFNAIILTDTFQSFNLIHAYDTGGFVNILARALINKDTCSFALSFPDTLRINTAYVNNASHYIFSVEFFDASSGTVYLSGVNKNFTGDTLTITTFDQSKHLLAGTFKTTMNASSSESPSVTQTSTYVTGFFNTYFNSSFK
jgi:hypothetical protein